MGNINNVVSVDTNTNTVFGIQPKNEKLAVANDYKVTIEMVENGYTITTPYVTYVALTDEEMIQTLSDVMNINQKF